MSKKVIDLNNQTEIINLSMELENHKKVSEHMKTPIIDAIRILNNWEQTHELTVEQIKNIYSKLHVSVNMSPDEMDEQFKYMENNINTENIVIIEKKFIKTLLCKDDFSTHISTILSHFQRNSSVEMNVLNAIQSIIENFSMICLTSNKNFSYKDVCFKFFTKCNKNNEILVLILNIHYEQKSFKWKFLDLFSCGREKISLSFLGALILTDIPIHRV